MPQSNTSVTKSTRLQLGTLLTTCVILFTHAAAAEDSGKQQYHIPAQPLQSAISQLSEQADLQISYPAELTKGIATPGLSGHYTAKEALNKLLAGSGLTPRVTSTNAITIEKTHNARGQPETGNVKPAAVTNPTPSPDDGVMLEKVTVEADSAYDPEYYADPYNKDYVIPNATAGTKTDTPIMETPLNVQVISKQVLKDQQVIRLADSFKNISGVTTINGASNGTLGGTEQHIFLRGFESSTFFRNGFRLQEGSASKGLANVEAVEVLKGPAAILYGLVEPGGMVNVITKQPLATPYYGFTQQFGSFDLYRTTFDATGPVTNNKDVLYRVNISYENSGSFRDLVDNEDVFFAPVLKWNINPQTQVTFELEYNRQRLGTQSGFIPFINGRPLNVPISRNYDEYSPATTETIFGSFNWSHQFNDDWSIKHRFSVNQRSLTAPSYTRAFMAGTKQFLQDSRGLFGYIPDPNLDALPDGSYVWRERAAENLVQHNTYSTNLDLIGHFDTYGLKHTLLMGGDYYRLESELDVSIQSSNLASYISIDNPVHPGTSPPPLDFRGHSTGKADQYGLYIQDQIKLPYDVQVMGGIRYQYIDLIDGNAGITQQVQDAVTPRVGLLWQPKKWLSLYANYVESFGANSGRVFPGAIVPPTSAEQYEGGIKAEFFDGKLRANLAYYDLTKTNVKVSDPRHPAPDCGDGCSLALGEVRSRGPELDITGEILPGWNVIATWSNTDIIVTKTNEKNEPIEGIGSPGSRLNNVPRNIGSLWSSYEVQHGDFKGLQFGGGVNLTDRTYVGNPNFSNPGYITMDLMAGYSRQLGDAKVSVQLNVNNLLDKRYFSAFNGGLAEFQGSWVDFGQPRTFMGQVSVQY
ncbi:MAG: TonB-dependent receptor [Methyloglobulus sp.]|nr:TonB-dependent receptor [Methyloglobulus sp.]